MKHESDHPFKLLKGVKTLIIGIWQDFTMATTGGCQESYTEQNGFTSDWDNTSKGFDSHSLQENMNTESVYFCSSYSKEDASIFRGHFVCRLRKWFTFTGVIGYDKLWQWYYDLTAGLPAWNNYCQLGRGRFEQLLLRPIEADGRLPNLESVLGICNLIIFEKHKDIHLSKPIYILSKISCTLEATAKIVEFLSQWEMLRWIR